MKQNKTPSEHKPGCTGKKRHSTEDAAIVFAVRMVRKTGPVRPYGCHYCKGWHLTSQITKPK